MVSASPLEGAHLAHYGRTMTRVSRQEALLNLIHARRSVTTSELEAALGASAATVRRDLAQLEEVGKLRRTFGGALAIEAKDDPFSEVLEVSRDAKLAIAQAAASQIEDGQTVILDVGTTTHYLAAQLANRRLTIITGSLSVLDVLAGAPEVALILLGGEYVTEYRCVTGPFVEDALRDIRADHAFLGCSGVTDAGDIRDTTVSQAQIKRAILRASERSTLLVDSAKFPGVGHAAVASISTLDAIITNSPLPDSVEELRRASGTELVVA